jgi:hypothetical protein
MIDLTALSRGLEGFRHLDPEQQQLAERLAIRAAIQRAAEAHEDVPESEQPDQAQIRDDPDSEDQRQGGNGHPDAQQEAAPDPDPPPEMDEGHILNLRV